MKYNNKILTIDVEDWFNILDVPSAPVVSCWNGLELRLERPLMRMLDLFNRHQCQATFFWLGWFAKRYPHLVRMCQEQGHEIASHGYAHLLANQVEAAEFRSDIRDAKHLLEDITGTEVKGFRAAGFSTSDEKTWIFDEIRAAGYLYDSSVFPAAHGHGGMSQAPLLPYNIETPAGPLFEIPLSVMSCCGRRLSVFGGGYLRLAPMWLINKGIRHLEQHGRPLIVYVHPREIDVRHPRLSMSPFRYFKSYINLGSTFPKLETLCRMFDFVPMERLLIDSNPPSVSSLTNR